MDNTQTIDASNPTATTDAPAPATSSQEVKETTPMDNATQPQTSPATAPAVEQPAPAVELVIPAKAAKPAAPAKAPTFAVIVRQAANDTPVTFDGEGGVTIGTTAIPQPHAGILNTLNQNGIAVTAGLLKELIMSGTYRALRIADGGVKVVLSNNRELHGASLQAIARDLLVASQAQAAPDKRGLALVVKGRFGDKLAVFDNGTTAPLDRFAEAFAEEGAFYNAFTVEVPMGEQKRTLALPLYFDEQKVDAAKAANPFDHELPPAYVKQALARCKANGFEVPAQLTVDPRKVERSAGREFTSIVKSCKATDAVQVVDGQTLVGSVKVEGAHARILAHIVKSGVALDGSGLKAIVQSGIYRGIRFAEGGELYVVDAKGQKLPSGNPVELAHQVMRDAYHAAPESHRAVVPIVQGKHGDMLAIMPNEARVAVDGFLDNVVEEGAYYPVYVTEFQGRGQKQYSAVPLFFEEAKLSMQDACRANGVRLPMPYLLQIRQHVALASGGVVKGAEEQAIEALHTGKTLRLGNFGQ